MAVDEIAERYGFPSWRSKFMGRAAVGTIADQRVLLLKPETSMNLSGQAVKEALEYSELDLTDIVVFHDEIELPPSKVRVKIGGSDAGHNGLRSISSHVGNNYKRVRIGVGHPRDWLGPGHPSLKDVVHRHVLSDFAKSDRPWVDALRKAVADNIGLLVAGLDSSFLNKVHLAMQAKGFGTTNDNGTD
jgi:PTH1 family peptidyl-tRNA hydrolase